MIDTPHAHTNTESQVTIIHSIEKEASEQIRISKISGIPQTNTTVSA